MTNTQHAVIRRSINPGPDNIHTGEATFYDLGDTTGSANLDDFGAHYLTAALNTEDYMNTQEGKNLPVPHCIRGTDGWQIRPELDALRTTEAIDKPTFGSKELGTILTEMNEKDEIGSITLIGLCTDICVISNAMLVKAFLPEVPIIVDSACCAGVTPESHENALKAMQVCQIKVV